MNIAIFFEVIFPNINLYFLFLFLKVGEDIGPDGYPLSGNSRQKRIRTSFKHHQLRILKSYFALNQNPDAKDLKQLTQKTGLTKRVLQVKWELISRA